MKTKNGHKLEHGQIIPLMALGVFVLAAMAVLVLDVGALLVNRRSAQNAADAGALAGARILCSNDSDTLPSQAIENEVIKYTEVENPATLISWYFTDESVGDTAGLTKGEIIVVAEVEHESFFAKIFGEDTLTASATAGAGCFSYQASVVLPIAWSCRPPVGGSASDVCDIAKIDYAVVEDIAEPILGQFPLPSGQEPTENQANAISTALFNYVDGEIPYNEKIYIIMNSEKVCGNPALDPDTVNCDFSQDGRDQLRVGGNRGWLNLDGGSGGTDEARDWIRDGLSVGLQPHTWFDGIVGKVAALYSDLSYRLDEIVWIPVFNNFCTEYPTEECMAKAHVETPPGVPLEPGQEDIVVEGSPGQMYYHVVAFAPFMPTCVKGPGDKPDKCPGFALAQFYNPEKNAIPNNTLAFEGYFVDPETLGEGVSFGADLGVYTVSLTR
jgi:hypothetical protein